MKKAITTLAATTLVAGCAVTGSGDPFEATCAETSDLSGLDSLAKSLVEEIEPPGDRDRARAKVAILISQECEGKPTSHKPGRAVARAAREQLGG